MAGDKNYLELLKKMEELHIKKNSGYSGDSQDRWANFRMAEDFGVSAVLGCLVRMSDKFIRIQNLVKNPKNEQVGEAITDTLMDLASYALITICLINEPKAPILYSPRVGDKVVPLIFVGSDGRDSTEWYKRGGKKQGYLYVLPNSSHVPEGHLLLSSTSDIEGGGDYFPLDKVIPYV